ncbi:MAG: squalene--hopene cyclase [Phycisphaeraceae bacterium]
MSTRPIDPSANAATPRRDQDLTAPAIRGMRRALDHLLGLQHADGHWRGELEGDSILQSEYILMKWILGQENTPEAQHALPRLAARLRHHQQPDGSWLQYPGGKMDLSATVKGYFALKLMGDNPQTSNLQNARDCIRAAGGAEKCNSFTRFYLAALGQIKWKAQPTIPPEIVFLPRLSYFHLSKVSAWTRTMILPLSVVTTFRPTRQLAPELGITELYVNHRRRHKLAATQDRPHWFWSRLFLALDKHVLRKMRFFGRMPWRKRALQRVERWMLDHLEGSDGLGAIFPPMVYVQIALRCLGYADDDPVLVKARKDLDALMIYDQANDEIRIQPCFSPVWDTGIAAYALAEAGLDRSHENVGRCSKWLVGEECRKPGDWAANVKKDVEPSGWAFEYNNPHYPDVDDTAMVSMALHRIGGRGAQLASWRAMEWMTAMQNKDGGWAAFDRTKHRSILEHVPFADHNAMQDPSCPDITGRVLESLGWHGALAEQPHIARALDYLQRTQTDDGAWYGRWGVNYIYGTFQVLCGLDSVGCDMDEPWIQRAGQWLKEHQHKSGGFGESPESYEDPARAGEGPTTASQTAWGTMGLLAVHGPADPDARRAVAWLCKHQTEAGTWQEQAFTGTGFPRVFYLRYHMYPHYFPLLALARYLRKANALPDDMRDTATVRT